MWLPRSFRLSLPGPMRLASYQSSGKKPMWSPYIKKRDPKTGHLTQSLATDMRRLFYSTWPPSFSSYIKKLSNRGGERRWPRNKTGVVHRYQATVASNYSMGMSRKTCLKCPRTKALVLVLNRGFSFYEKLKIFIMCWEYLFIASHYLTISTSVRSWYVIMTITSEVQ